MTNFKVLGLRRQQRSLDPYDLIDIVECLDDKKQRLHINIRHNVKIISFDYNPKKLNMTLRPKNPALMIPGFDITDTEIVNVLFSFSSDNYFLNVNLLTLDEKFQTTRDVLIITNVRDNDDDFKNDKTLEYFIVTSSSLGEPIYSDVVLTDDIPVESITKYIIGPANIQVATKEEFLKHFIENFDEDTTFDDQLYEEEDDFDF